jgi:L-fuculose-phosphate aldolase
MIACHPVATVRSPYTSREHTPRATGPDTAAAWIELSAEMAPAAQEISPGDRLILLTWLHQADRTVLRCHPMADPNIPERGVFLTRSPDRPNPIGIHPVTVLQRHGLRILVYPLEALDGTPILDIKNADRPGRRAFDPAQAIMEAGRRGWQRGLFPGASGNISLRLDSTTAMVTASGRAKGFLTPEDLAVVDLATGTPRSGAPSSETPAHLAVYQLVPKARAIVHTHPPRLTALMLQGGFPTDLPLFETERIRLETVPALPPGSPQLATAVAQAAQAAPAVFLHQHGLLCWGESLDAAMALTEELEHLAQVALDVRRVQPPFLTAP